MNESLENSQPKKKPELGNFEFVPDIGLALRKKVSLWDILKDEVEYVKSKSRNKAISDLEKEWNNLFEVQVSEEIMKILRNPAGFEIFIRSLIEEGKINIVKKYIEENILGLKKLEKLFETAKESFLNYKMDFEKADNMDINDENELKDILKEKIDLINKHLESVKIIAGFINSKLDELE